MSFSKHCDASDWRSDMPSLWRETCETLSGGRWAPELITALGIEYTNRPHTERDGLLLVLGRVAIGNGWLQPNSDDVVSYKLQELLEADIDASILATCGMIVAVSESNLDESIQKYRLALNKCSIGSFIRIIESRGPYLSAAATAWSVTIRGSKPLGKDVADDEHLVRLIKVLDEELYPRDLSRLINCLATFSQESARAAAARFVTYPDSDVRRSLAYLFGGSSSSNDLDILSTLCRDHSPTTRTSAFEAIAIAQNEYAVGAAVNGLSDLVGGVRIAATQALASIDRVWVLSDFQSWVDNASVSRIRGMFEDAEKGWMSGSGSFLLGLLDTLHPKFRPVIAGILARKRNSLAEHESIALFHHSSETVRKTAVKSMGQPWLWLCKGSENAWIDPARTITRDTIEQIHASSKVPRESIINELKKRERSLGLMFEI